MATILTLMIITGCLRNGKLNCGNGFSMGNHFQTPTPTYQAKEYEQKYGCITVKFALFWSIWGHILSRCLLIFLPCMWGAGVTSAFLIQGTASEIWTVGAGFFGNSHRNPNNASIVPVQKTEETFAQGNLPNRKLEPLERFYGPSSMGMLQRPLTWILLQKYRDTHGRRIVI